MSEPITHPAEVRQLFEKMTKIEVPPTLRRIAAPIPGTAFFPGGFGLWCEGRSAAMLPKGGVMVIGNTFGNEEEHRNALYLGSEDLDANNTWHNLLLWLAVAGREPWKCFFTNAFIGLWPKNSSGPAPSHSFTQARGVPAGGGMLTAVPRRTTRTSCVGPCRRVPKPLGADHVAPGAANSDARG